MTKETNRPALRVGATILTLAAVPPDSVLAQQAFALDPVTLAETDETGTEIATGDADDSGTTALGADAVQIRSDGSGDANTALTSLPNVQYRDTPFDSGVNVDDILDLKPLEFSISGGRVSGNAIRLNGTGIGSATGNTHPHTSEDLSRQTGNPGTYSFYGLHSQTQFVPSAMVDSIEVRDSNISAEYGGFEGGVIDYTLTQPDAARASGKVSLSFQNDALVHYRLGTEDGDNPDRVPKPDFSKREVSAEFNQPLGENTAVIFGFGRRMAEATKAKEPQYRPLTADDDSRSDFWRLSLAHEFENGDQLELNGYLTDYSQGWDSPWTQDYHLDVETRNLSLDASYTRQLGSFDLGPASLSNVKLTLGAVHQDNEASNSTDQNTFLSWFGSYFSTLRGQSYHTDAFDAWCDTPDTPSAAEDYHACRRGGYGSKSYSDTRNRIEAELEADLGRGRFKFGAYVERVDARQSGDGFTSYTLSTYLDASDPFGSFTCPAGDPACIDDQYLRTRIVQDAYDISTDATLAEAYLEYDRSFGDFGLRGGLRFSYNDVLKNTDIAPRLSASWTPGPDFAVVAGANRYYSGEYISYAIHDALPRGANERRSHDATTGEVGAWTPFLDLGSYSYTQDGLKTPYVDETSLAVMYRDAWTRGTWRLKLIDRQGRDQFARSADSTGSNNLLSNDGTTEYRSVSLEYEKRWRGGGALDDVGLYLSGVWADSDMSNDTYFGDEGDIGDDEFIWYDGRSYTRNEFDQRTGRRDIPVRATVELGSNWKNGRFGLGVGADVSFAYTGVRNTDERETHSHPTYGARTHDVYEDYEFDTAVSAFLTARVRLAQLRGGDLDLNVKVANLFDDTGGGTATDSNPWIPGRSFYVGTTYSW
ncbi:hypothetical protein BYZ73_13430 [Rhodovulum viride]|uniref:Outer membrane receptor protein involved in Fe transport n=1 Tax=Rhodovulum viride TaxID=1231134 RepID=A0ABX9DF68_9RHOB|nr:TonB-dependent receptor [Rhodovulum viride]RAP40768.1 hypothetical protein BYZ73_13430 [Rhodovulum viride]